MSGRVCILGIFVADTAYSAPRLPAIGETILGTGFVVGPGGKGSNQAVAAARSGARVSLISRIGADTFGQMADATWAADRIEVRVERMADAATGAAFIFIDDRTGDNAIIVCPGAAGHLSPEDAERHSDAIAAADVFVTQLEQPAAAALRALELARAAGVVTVFNPAPAGDFPDAIYPLCDYIVPNESEAGALTGIGVTGIETARRAADVLLSRGARAVVVTLGARGALLHDARQSLHFPARDVARVVDTTGAGDAFLGGFATALAEGRAAAEAVSFGIAASSIAIGRPGTAPAMPTRAEIDALLAQ